MGHNKGSRATVEQPHPVSMPSSPSTILQMMMKNCGSPVERIPLRSCSRDQGSRSVLEGFRFYTDHCSPGMTSERDVHIGQSLCVLCRQAATIGSYILDLDQKSHTVPDSCYDVLQNSYEPFEKPTTKDL
ncbi:hypothetical protein AFLA_010274 [Aspergillus flavus NRRL3357]|nr:hypothetical protein AFLA_010274 [Aspergillus flavus NRRL3357]